MGRLGDFWGRRKNLKIEYLVEGHSYRSDTSPVTRHRSSTPSVFFWNFYSHCSRCNDVINFWGKPVMGNFRPAFRVPLSLFSSFDDDICLKWSGIGYWRSWNPQFWKKKVGGNEFTPTTIYPIFRNFQVDFSIFFKTEYVRDEWSGCCSEVTFSKITPWGPLGFPKLF